MTFALVVKDLSTSLTTCDQGARPSGRVAIAPRVNAVEEIGPLPGSTRPWLLRADDGFEYAVKFTSNPNGPRILINEYVAARFARSIGLRTPEIALVYVPGGMKSPPGIHFGSRIKANRDRSCAYKALPAMVWEFVQNAEDLAGAFALDAWIGNTDERQVLISRENGARPFRIYLIDNGHCFGGTSWRIRNGTVSYATALSYAYATPESTLALWSTVSKIEALGEKRIGAALDGLPLEWFAGGNDLAAFQGILYRLVQRCACLRAELCALLTHGSHPFCCPRHGVQSGTPSARAERA